MARDVWKTRPPYGSFAERAVTRKELTVPLPEGLNSVTAAGLANPGMSSWVALTARAKFIHGENVLILGATGASGLLAVQIARRLGAGRVVAAARNAQALTSLPALGADAVIRLDQDRGTLIAAYRSEIADHGLDAVLDYLWGEPANTLLAAIAQKDLNHAAPRVRYIQIGSIAGETVSLSAATLRSTGLELLGSGFGSASMKEIFDALANFFREAAAKPFVSAITRAPLSQVETLWNTPNAGSRLVFQP